MKKAIFILLIISLVIQGGNAMDSRVKKLTDANYSPTIPDSEEDIRTQIDGSIQEVYDIVDEAKLDKTSGDYTGSWHGIAKPVYAEPGLAGVVDALDASLTAHKAESAHIATAYVATDGNDATAVLGREDKKFKTINAALDALPSTGGVIKLGLGAFSYPDPAKWKHNVALLGAKMPMVNSAQTALINGTVIKGSLTVRDFNDITIKDLGVDCGSDYSATAVNTLVVASTNFAVPVKGINIDNVITLAKDSTSAIHSCLLEGLIQSTIGKITTYHGVHGFVLKGSSCQVDTITAFDSSADAVIIKDDAAANCQSNNISNIIIKKSLADTGGLIIDSSEAGADLRNLNINNILISSTTFGIKFASSALTKSRFINIANVVIDSIENQSLWFNGVCENIDIVNLKIIGALGVGIVYNANAKNINIANATLIAGVSGTTAIVLDGDNNKFSNVNISAFTANWSFAGTNHKINNSTIGTYTGTLSSVLIDNADYIAKLPTLGNGFSIFGALYSQPKYYKVNKTIHLEGRMNLGTLNVAIFTLPAGYTPPENKNFTTRSETGTADVDVMSNGDVICRSCSGTWLSLDSIEFML